MIKVTYQRDEKLKEWYVQQISAVLKGKQPVKKFSDPLLDFMHQKMLTLDPKELADILLEDKNSLAKQYDWIGEYVKLCDFTAYYDTLRDSAKEKRTYTPLRLEYLDRHKGYYLNELISRLATSEAALTRSWKNFDRLYRKAKLCCEELNQIISDVLDYSFMPQDIRHQLYRKTEVQVCPYCNRQYIHTVSVTKHAAYLGDLDHFYPKSTYQLFSLSLWNLIPVCKPCNQLFKRQYNRKILSPTTAGFGDDCIFKVRYQDVLSMLGLNENFTCGWEIQKYAPEDKKAMIRQNLDMFRLNEVYQFHKQDIQDILRKHHLRSKILADRQDAFLGNFCLSTEDLNRLVYGTTLNKDNFHKELLGKMIYDIVVRE